MALSESPAAAIVWAQFRTLLNFYRKPQMGGYWVGTAVMAIWYSMVAAGAVGISYLLATIPPARYSGYAVAITFGMLAAFLYWQLVPVFMAQMGLSLEIRKLLVYPIPLSQLFHIEVLLRMSIGLEVLILLIGVFAGLIQNRAIPFWAPFTLILFVVFNLYLSAGIKDLLARLMERKGVREAVVLGFILLTVSPQMITLVGLPAGVREALVAFDQSWFPWGTAAQLAIGHRPYVYLPLALFWAGAAALFGRWQFQRTLYFDVESARADSGHGGTTSKSPFVEALFDWPSRVFRDPLAALVEKDLRTLARSSRFRLVFFMGFTFGLVVWFPLAFGHFTGGPAMQTNFLTWISIYSLMLLGEVALFNHLGFDRAAAQLYWVTPVSLRTVLRAKNIVALVYVFLEIGIVTVVCLALRLPIGIGKVFEAFGVTVVLAIFLAAIGNLGSVYYPKPANPQQSWRSRGGNKLQVWMLLAYPVLGTPIALAYLARYAFESQLAFYAVLGFTAVIAAAFYHVAMDTAEAAALERRESILTALGQGEGPIG